MFAKHSGVAGCLGRYPIAKKPQEERLTMTELGIDAGTGKKIRLWKLCSYGENLASGCRVRPKRWGTGAKQSLQ